MSIRIERIGEHVYLVVGVDKYELRPRDVIRLATHLDLIAVEYGPGGKDPLS